MAIKTGDIVWLKSGSPRMTAGHKFNDGFRCHWFDSDLHLQEGNFVLAELSETEPIVLEDDLDDDDE